MPFRDTAIQNLRWLYEPSASATTHDVVFGLVRSGKSVIRPTAVSPKPSGAATPLLPSQAAATGDEA